MHDQCGTIVCDACALTHHDGHDKIPLKQAAIERREEFKSKIESKKKRLKTMKDEMRNFEKEWPEIQENAVHVERSVQKFADEMISVIEAKKEAIITEVKESIQCQEARHSENEREIKITEEALELAETLLKRSPNVEIVQPNKFIDNVLQNHPAKVVQDFDEKSDDSDVLPESCGISVDNDGNIIVPDCREKSVKIFYPGGQLLRTIGEGQLFYPSHCIQYRDHFFCVRQG